LDEKRKTKILERHYLKCLTDYIQGHKTLELLNFEPLDSVWIDKFYRAFEIVNTIDAIPYSVKPCRGDRKENVLWALRHLAFLCDHTHYLFPTKQHSYLANVEIKNLENTLYEFWEPGLNFTLANKEIKKFVHIFEAEYEYQLYIVDLS